MKTNKAKILYKLVKENNITEEEFIDLIDCEDKFDFAPIYQPYHWTTNPYPDPNNPSAPIYTTSNTTRVNESHD
jgi:hypothetical protein